MRFDEQLAEINFGQNWKNIQFYRKSNIIDID